MLKHGWSVEQFAYAKSKVLGRCATSYGPVKVLNFARLQNAIVRICSVEVIRSHGTRLRHNPRNTSYRFVKHIQDLPPRVVERGPHANRYI
jgi:hypothetical protein